LLLTGVVALLIVTVCGGGGLLAANRFGLAQAGARHTPTATRVPTATPEPTATTEPTATAAPVPRLTVSPLQLIRGSRSTTCKGTQYITNNAGRSLQWQWQSATPDLPDDLRWGFTSSPSSQVPPLPSHNSLDSGQTDTVYFAMTCDGQTFKVSLTDSLGRAYTFTMQSQ
jgi:hypothetical protein